VTRKATDGLEKKNKKTKKQKNKKTLTLPIFFSLVLVLGGLFYFAAILVFAGINWKKLIHNSKNWSPPSKNANVNHEDTFNQYIIHV